MIKIFVDSGSSIKEHEKNKYGVEIIPLKVMLDGKEYEDGIDLDYNEFYEYLQKGKKFPKTSLPNLYKLEEKVNECIKNNDQVIILTISSGISSTYSAIKSYFEDNNDVYVIDSLSAVGGIRILINEIKKHLNKGIHFILDKVEKLKHKIRILAVPETLDYLHKGGRLSAMGYFVGSLLRIKPLITFENGKVKVYSKEHGMKASMRKISEELKNCDENYEIVASYTHNRENLDVLVSKIDEKYKKLIEVYDDLDLAIASHWGPNAFGFIYVEE